MVDKHKAHTAGIEHVTVNAEPISAETAAQRADWRTTLPGFLRWYVVLATMLGIIGLLLAGGEISHQRQVLEVKAQERVALAAKNIDLHFKTVISDLRYLAGSEAVRRFANGRPQARAEMAGGMLGFAASKPEYEQIRFVDAGGQERVRVNQDDHGARLVPDERLQDKSERYYVSETLAMDGGAIFVSPMDLNVEHGRVERPFNPVIRFATPVLDAGGRKAGVVVINYRAAELLDDFRTVFPEQGTLHLLNSDGYWLSSPNPDDAWGFMFPRQQQRTFGSRHPGAWQAIRDQTAGSYRNDDGYFVFARIQPLRAGLQAASTDKDLFGNGRPQLAADTYHWIIVARYPLPGFADVLTDPPYLGMLLLTLAAAAIGAWFIARNAEQERARRAHLLQVRDQLASQVADRTRLLEDSRQRLAQLLNSAAEGIFGVDADGRCTFINRAALTMLGYGDESDLASTNLCTCLAPEGNGAEGTQADPVGSVLRQGRGIRLDEGSLRRADGSALPADIRVEPICQDDRVRGAVVSFVDISARKRSEQRIRILSKAVEQSPVAVIITDPNGSIEYVNRAFENATGYTAGEVLGRNPSMLQSGQVSPRAYRELWQTLSTGRAWVGEFRNRSKDGRLYWVRAYIAPVSDERGEVRHLLGIEEDITQYKLQEDKILHQAHYDFLTDLPNRFLALDRLERLIKNGARLKKAVAVLFLDLDDFKKINDTLGHETGDRLLIEAAKRLGETVREQDTVSRLGGDEFLVILGDTGSAASTERVAQHLLQAFRTPFLIDSHELVVTASIGIAVYPQDGAAASHLLRSADLAMYQAKQAGRNTYQYFTAAMNRSVERRLAIEARLRGALQRGDLAVHYQAIVSLRERRPVGAEALLRWRDEELGQVSPAEFIPVAEQTGLIDVLGMYVLSEAANQCARFRRRFGDDFYLSVNASPAQFREGAFPGYVESALATAGLPGDALVLEITEGVLLSGYPQVDSILGRLHDMGVRLAMDDFGTGYASLGYLRNYPFDILKIDREFVRDIPGDANDCELVRAALQMAHALKLSVVAEGVEEEAQLLALCSWGCDLGQGYLFGRPSVAADFSATTSFSNCRDTAGDAGAVPPA